jgi:hypothetical protein
MSLSSAGFPAFPLRKTVVGRGALAAGVGWPSVTWDAELTAAGNTTLSDPLIGATLVA